MGEAMTVPSRLWLGGVISPKRDLALITAVVPMVRSSTRSLAILVYVDGLASYVTALTRLYRDPQRTGRRGRRQPIATAGLLPGQVINHRLTPADASSVSPAGRSVGPPRRLPRCTRRPAPGQLAR